jgi:hypothetical protein
MTSVGGIATMTGVIANMHGTGARARARAEWTMEHGK